MNAHAGRRLRRVQLAAIGLVGGVLASLVALAPPASAHPLGNATVNHYDGLHLYQDRVTDLAVEDVAEIPTLQRKPGIDANGDATISAAERDRYATSQCARLVAANRITVDGRRVPMQVERADYSERPGAIRLRVGRLECQLSGTADLGANASVAADLGWDSAGIGWHEITAVGTGVALHDSPFPATSISDALRRYPNDMLSSPLDVRSGSVATTPGQGTSSYVPLRALPGAGPATRALNAVSNSFNGLVGARHLTIGVGLLAVLLSLLLGAGHAFLPGHGKTIMAAYLVGRRGGLRDVVAVGATVTITHTAGVLVLGLLISLTSAFAPTAAEQGLGIVSGLIVAVVGVGLLVAAVRRLRTRSAVAIEIAEAVRGAATSVDASESAAAGTGPHPALEAGVADSGVTGPLPDGHAGVAVAERSDIALTVPGHDHHPHPHPHAHTHHNHHGHDHVHGHGSGHSHDHPCTQPGEAKRFGRGGLVGLGVAGGLVPSPSALLVLLAAIALGRTVFGVVLVLGYGLGMAGALTMAGLLLVTLRDRLARTVSGRHALRATRLISALPVLTGLLVLIVGLGLILRAAHGIV